MTENTQNWLNILKDVRLSRSAFLVLSFLYTIDEPWTKSQSELGNRLNLSRLTIIKAFKDLAQQGYIVKETNPERRNAKIYKIKEGQDG